MEEQAPRQLHERLDWLFKKVTKPGGTEYTYQEVETGTEVGGYRVTAAAIWKIRKGETQNPGYRVVQTLARFFGVDESFFYAATLTQEDLERARLAASLRERGVDEIALRSADLDQSGRDAILQMLRYMAGTSDAEDDSS